MKNDLGYWMGWIVAAAVAALSYFTLGIFMFFRNEVCTGYPGEQCAREWISATGSWAAVPAAVLTIIFLSRQISRADRHHRENVRLQVEYKYEIAQAAFASCQFVNFQVELTQTAAYSHDEALYKAMSNELLDKLTSAFNERDAWDQFDKHFVVASVSVRDVRDALRIASSRVTPKNTSEFSGSVLEEALKLTSSYSTYVGQTAEGFLDRIDKMLS